MFREGWEWASQLSASAALDDFLPNRGRWVERSLFRSAVSSWPSLLDLAPLGFFRGIHRRTHRMSNMFVHKMYICNKDGLHTGTRAEWP